MTKYRSKYINLMTHGHRCEIVISSYVFKWHDRFTYKVMSEFSCKVMSKVKYRWLERIVNCLRTKFPEKKGMALGKVLLVTLGRYLNERTLTLSKKDLDAVVHGSEAERVEIGLETVELINGEKLLFNLKETTIL